MPQVQKTELSEFELSPSIPRAFPPLGQGKFNIVCVIIHRVLTNDDIIEKISPTLGSVGVKLKS